jgi:hypothetical protein
VLTATKDDSLAISSLDHRALLTSFYLTLWMADCGFEFTSLPFTSAVSLQNLVLAGIIPWVTISAHSTWMALSKRV